MSLKAKIFKWLSGTDYDYYKDSYNRMLIMNEKLIDDGKQLIDSSKVIQDVYDDRIKNIEALIAKVKTVSELYKDLAKDYNELITNHDELVKKYNKIVKSNNNAINLLHKYAGMDGNDDKLRGSYFYAGYTTVITAIKEAVENWVIEPINKVGSEGTAIFEDSSSYFIDVQELTRIVKTYLTMHDKDFIQVDTDVVICTMLRDHKILELTEDNKSMWWCGNVYHQDKVFIKIDKYTLSKALDGGDNSAD